MGGGEGRFVNAVGEEPYGTQYKSRESEEGSWVKTGLEKRVKRLIISTSSNLLIMAQAPKRQELREYRE